MTIIQNKNKKYLEREFFWTPEPAFNSLIKNISRNFSLETWARNKTFCDPLLGDGKILDYLEENNIHFKNYVGVDIRLDDFCSGSYPILEAYEYDLFERPLPTYDLAITTPPEKQFLKFFNFFLKEKKDGITCLLGVQSFAFLEEVLIFERVKIIFLRNIQMFGEISRPEALAWIVIDPKNTLRLPKTNWED